MRRLKLGLVFSEMSRLALTETSVKCIISLGEYSEALQVALDCNLQAQGSDLLSLRCVRFL
jgi:hypothetical protein